MSEKEGLLHFILGNQPAAESNYHSYSLEDFREFYSKVCSQLSEKDSALMYELFKSSENDIASHSNLIGMSNHPAMKRPYNEKELREAKEDYLHGLLCGISLEYLEAIADEFSFGLAEKMEIGNNECILFLSMFGTKQQRSFDELFKLQNRLVREDARYCGFVTHRVDGNDYALVGKRLPESEYQKRLHEWGLDKDWDGEI
ncbi:MAG: hypothetical protein N3E51_04730 [Candidatus Micrarchaeota archaeon]|nr:hypothetical protein [Candidatus Micrarchaeota archaeon]